MNRVTEWRGEHAAVIDNHTNYIDRLAAYEDTGLTPEICSEYKIFEDEAISKGVAFRRIVELMNAESEGRLVVLPCKIEDTVVYQLRSKKHAKGEGISPRVISCARVWRNGKYSLCHQGQNDCRGDDFKKTWFLTREEAEAALKGGEGE